MRLLLDLLLALMLSAPGSSQQPIEAFEASRYDSPRWKVTEQTYPFGDLSIRIVHVQALSAGWDDLPDAQRFLCKGFLEVRKGDHVVERLYGAEIEPVGGSAGLFVPESQPIQDHFLVAKFGDYDERLFLISRDGKAVDMPDLVQKAEYDFDPRPYENCTSPTTPLKRR